jgi:2-keto-4-pentenoate hydratase
MTSAQHEAVASALFNAWRERTFIPAPSRGEAVFLRADAVAIAERLRELRIVAGATCVGYKVGFTNAAVRAQFDAEAQLAAPVYDETLVPEPRIDARHLLGPRIEPEVVVGLDARAQIAWVALGFEIVQSHIPGWEFGYLDAIADFGLHAALIVGERRPIGEAGAAFDTAMPVRLLRNGEVVERGAGSDVDGGASGSLRWLRDDLRRAGRDLLPGDIVTTGSMTRVPPIASGER